MATGSSGISAVLSSLSAQRNMRVYGRTKNTHRCTQGHRFRCSGRCHHDLIGGLQKANQTLAWYDLIFFYGFAGKWPICSKFTSSVWFFLAVVGEASPSVTTAPQPRRPLGTLATPDMARGALAISKTTLGNITHKHLLLNIQKNKRRKRITLTILTIHIYEAQKENLWNNCTEHVWNPFKFDQKYAFMCGNYISPPKEKHI